MIKARAAKAYRRTCGLLALPFKRPMVGPITLALTFHPPTRASYDEDNLVARMKSGLDGLADGLGVNDKLFRLAAPVIGEKRPPGCVVVDVTYTAVLELRGTIG